MKMKKITLFIGLAAIALNVAFLLILSHYELFNFILSSLVVLSTMLFILVSSNTSPNDGFKIGLTFFFSITFFVRIVLSLISEPVVKDNPLLIIIICITLLESIVLFIPNLLKKS
jgi:hypothetical protein